MSKSRAHKMSQYNDGNVWVPFCSVCSAEGFRLTESCPGGYVEKKKPVDDKIVDTDKEPS